ncbi:MAG: UPF0149 family protein [Halioglobus sp.]|nr:UPF0149 family protein [Halioglobus sp.]
MYDEALDEIPALNFDEIANHLLEQGGLVSPSQIEGCLCGLQSGGANVEPEYGLDALADVLGLHAHGELADCVVQMYTLVGAALRDDDFRFTPLLPSDDVELAQRVEALSDWCNGFLSGFAFEAASDEKGGSTLSPPSNEALRDIAAFAQVEVGEDEGADDAEGHYAELVEYLRVAVINIFLDDSDGDADGEDGLGDHKSLQ